MRRLTLRTVLFILATLILAGCFPAGHTYTEGPWKGCVTSADGGAIDCDYAPMTEPERRSGPPRVAEPEPEPPIVVPGPVRPLPPTPDPDPEPEPDPDPEPPITVPDPPVEPDPEPEPPLEPDPDPDPDPEPDPEPDPDPEPEPDPDPDPDPEPDPPADPPVRDCKPGWGHGDKNHCHDGPPGLDRP